MKNFEEEEAAEEARVKPGFKYTTDFDFKEIEGFGEKEF